MTPPPRDSILIRTATGHATIEGEHREMTTARDFLPVLPPPHAIAKESRITLWPRQYRADKDF